MENREQISQQEQLIKAMNLCVEIQNAGIATVFVDFSGHVNITYVKIHVPLWVSNSTPDYKFELRHDKDDDDPTYNWEKNEVMISQLEEILSAGRLPHDNEQELIRCKEKQARKLKYEELKKEFEPELV